MPAIKTKKPRVRATTKGKRRPAPKPSKLKAAADKLLLDDFRYRDDNEFARNIVAYWCVAHAVDRDAIMRGDVAVVLDETSWSPDDAFEGTRRTADAALCGLQTCAISFWLPDGPRRGHCGNVFDPSSDHCTFEWNVATGNAMDFARRFVAFLRIVGSEFYLKQFMLEALEHYKPADSMRPSGVGEMNHARWYAEALDAFRELFGPAVAKPVIGSALPRTLTRALERKDGAA